LQLRKDEGNQEKMAEGLLGLAGVALGRGDIRRAAILLGAVRGILDQGKHLDIPERKALEKNTAAVRSQLGEDTFKAVYAEGHTMTVDAAVDYALGSA